jgi:hypothetical protein
MGVALFALREGFLIAFPVVFASTYLVAKRSPWRFSLLALGWPVVGWAAHALTARTEDFMHWPPVLWSLATAAAYWWLLPLDAEARTETASV